MRHVKAVALVVALFFLGRPTTPARGMSITDVNTGDLNTITSVTHPSTVLHYINEDYNETHLVPFPSHDGYAIVNATGGFFDKVVTLTAEERAQESLKPFPPLIYGYLPSFSFRLLFLDGE